MATMTTRELDRLAAETPQRYGGSAVQLIALEGGEVVARLSSGAVRAWDAPGAAAHEHWPEATPRTRFDLASVTKPMVATALLDALHERGSGPELPVAELLPEFARGALRRVTVMHLLTHTAGFPAEWGGRQPDPDAAIFRGSARPLTEPGARFEYSCVGYVWAGLALAALDGAGLDAVLQRRVLDPIGMRSTGYRRAGEGGSPDAAFAATEWQEGRGLVHGEVHDETAWALGGVSGNAGLFGTLDDVARFAEAIRLGGELDGRRVISEAVHEQLTTPRIDSGEGYAQSCGMRVDDEWSRALGSGTVGHPGFTGTAMAATPGGARSFVLLTNRVHPVRTGGPAPEMRAALCTAVPWQEGRP